MGAKLLFLTYAHKGDRRVRLCGFLGVKRVSYVGLSPPVGRWAMTDPMILGESI
jgi:hypothetical protein